MDKARAKQLADKLLNGEVTIKNKDKILEGLTSYLYN